MQIKSFSEFLDSQEILVDFLTELLVVPNRRSTVTLWGFSAVSHADSHFSAIYYAGYIGGLSEVYPEGSHNDSFSINSIL